MIMEVTKSSIPALPSYQRGCRYSAGPFLPIFQLSSRSSCGQVRRRQRGAPRGHQYPAMTAKNSPPYFSLIPNPRMYLLGSRSSMGPGLQRHKHHPLIKCTEGIVQKLLNNFSLLRHFCSHLPHLIVLLDRGRSNTLHGSDYYLV